MAIGLLQILDCPIYYNSIKSLYCMWPVRTTSIVLLSQELRWDLIRSRCLYYYSDFAIVVLKLKKYYI